MAALFLALIAGGKAEPRYVNCSTSTMLSGCPSMWILGAMYGDLFFGWWSTSAFFKLTIPVSKEGAVICK